MKTSSNQSGRLLPGEVSPDEQNRRRAVGGVCDRVQALFGEVNALAGSAEENRGGC